MENQKPPTQGVGVIGFKADVYAVDEVKIDWPLLMTLPKFQMYCVELSRRNHGEGRALDWWFCQR